MINNDGEYEGEFLNDLAHGNGVFTYKDGTKYTGEWQNDNKHG